MTSGLCQVNAAAIDKTNLFQWHVTKTTQKVSDCSFEKLCEKVYRQITLSVPKRSLFKEIKYMVDDVIIRSLTFKTGDTFTSAKRRQLWNVGLQDSIDDTGAYTMYFLKSIEKGNKPYNNLMNSFLSPYTCGCKYLAEVWCQKRVLWSIRLGLIFQHSLAV